MRSQSCSCLVALALGLAACQSDGDIDQLDGATGDGGVVDTGPGADGGVGLDGGAPADADAPVDGGEREDASAADATPIDAGPPQLPAAPEPAPTVFGPTIDTLSVAIRTADLEFAGTDSGQELCLNETRCFRLDTPDVDDFRRGEVDVYHFEGVNLLRSAVRNISLRTTSDPAMDNNRWEVSCLELRFDGEPVYCNPAVDARIGTGDSAWESRTWTDRNGLRNLCATCQSGTLTHGPMQGAPEPDRVRVWARTDATRRVGLRMGTTPDLDGASVVAWSDPSPLDDFATTLDVAGLSPATTYYYRVEVDGAATQPARAIQTAPASTSADSFRFAFGSCSREAEQPIFDVIAQETPALFLFVGDNHYANSNALAAHRWHYRFHRAIAPRAAFIASVPTVAIWDDHDFLANNSHGMCLGREDARRAFTNYWANPSVGEGGEGVYFRQRFGPAEFFMLDCRSFRPDVGDSAADCALDPAAPPLFDVDGPLGRPQHDWLIAGLAESDATFKFVACGSRFTPEGSLDSWASFDEARDRLLGEIQARGVEGVVLLSGDIHRSQLRTVRGPGYPLPELVSSPLATTPGLCHAGDATDRRVCVSERSFITVDVQAELPDPRLDVRIVGDDGGERATWSILRSELE